MVNIEDKIIKLIDGRQVAYTEHGLLSGKPVFFFHGNPGCRLQRHPDETIAEKLGLRIITPDRPGYGLSDYQDGRKLLDYPDDILQLADALSLDSFSLFGVSAGGIYAAACAYKFPERIHKAAIVSGPEPLDRKDAFDEMSPPWAKAFKLARLPRWPLGMIYKIQSGGYKKNPETVVDQFAMMLSKSDRELLMQKEFRDGVIERRMEATRQGVIGMIQEAKVIISPWGFSPEDIKINIQLWYWEDDPAIPIEMGRFLESKIPNTTAHFFSGGGHLSVFYYWNEILEGLI